MIFAMSVLTEMAKAPTATVWYGPATATFPVQFAGNPYDPAENDVTVQFKDKRGHVETRLAFFNNAIGSWQAILVAPESGSFRAQLLRNGSPSPVADREGVIKLMAPLPHGFVRPDSRHSNRFVWDDGTPCTPIGFDLGWQNPAILPITDQVAKMGKSGVNWTRIWACSWDGKNPWWPSDHSKLEPRTLWPAALMKWEAIEEACSAANVGLQLVLFHHGEFSSKVDPNWPENPWNVKNGGFLQKPGDFFTDPEAKTRAKIWLRYAVARYGASPALFGWELFNEVQWVDPIQIDHRWDEVEAWHKEMADYIRSIDPYHHPVTSSSELRPNFDSSLDYLQPHTYPNNIFASVVGTVMPPGKPGFYGEFGPGNMQGVDLHRAILDGLLGGLLANHAGAGMFWYWDTVEQKNLYSSFLIGRKVADLSHWDRHPDAKIAPISVHTQDKSTFVFQPGVGWGPTTQFVFNLPNGASAAALGKISSYIQGTNNRNMMPEPIQLNFSLDGPSRLTVRIGDISNTGGNLDVKLDGTIVSHGSYKHGETIAPIEVPLTGGAHSVILSNDGADWVGLKSVSIDNLAPLAGATALAEGKWMMLRLSRNDAGTGLVHVDLSDLPLPADKYHVAEINLQTGDVKQFEASVKDSKLGLEVSNPDEILIFSHSG
jgi:hypothetical protein